MVLVFILLAIFILLLTIIFLVLLSTFRIEIKNLKLSNIENKNQKSLSKISNLIKSLNYKIATNFSKKDKIKINNIKFILDELFNHINTTNNIKVRKLTCSA